MKSYFLMMIFNGDLVDNVSSCNHYCYIRSCIHYNFVVNYTMIYFLLFYIDVSMCTVKEFIICILIAVALIT